MRQHDFVPLECDGSDDDDEEEERGERGGGAGAVPVVGRCRVARGSRRGSPSDASVAAGGLLLRARPGGPGGTPWC
ncbi:unnamed protein product, partial [Lampetra fluviatilis]